MPGTLLPQKSGVLQRGITFQALPSKTVRLDLTNGRLSGFTDGLEAVRQAVYVILNVERYQYLIHSWNFGVELRDLFGKPMTWVMPEVKRRIAEALLRDDRITAVDGFVLTPDQHRLSVSFTVHSVFGNFEGVTEVDV